MMPVNPIASVDPLIWARIRRTIKMLPKAAYDRLIAEAKNNPEMLSSMENFLKAAELAVNSVEGKQESILHHTVRHRELQRVKDLLSTGARPNVRNRQGQTALDVAVEVNSVEIAQLLMRNGAIASKPIEFEKWIITKTSKEINGFLNDGYEPVGKLPENIVEVSTRVLWVSSNFNALREELIQLMSHFDKLHEFVCELARQQSEKPLFQCVDPNVVLLGWGIVPACPILNEASWNYLSLCLEEGIVTGEALSQTLLKPRKIQFSVDALAALPKEKPTGAIRFFYNEYVLKIKYELFGSLWKPTEELLTRMAEKLEWHEKEWRFIQTDCDTSISPKEFSADIDPAIEAYLSGNFQKARELGLPRASVEQGQLLLEKKDLPNGIALLKEAVDRGIVIACRMLALAPNISVTTLKAHMELSHLIKQLNAAGDPASKILASRNRQVVGDVETICDSPFRGDAIDALKTSIYLTPFKKENRALLKEWAAEGVVAALVRLALDSVAKAKRLVELAKQGDEEAKRYAVQLFRGKDCTVSPEVMRYLYQNVPLNWLLMEEKIDLEAVFRDEKAPDLKEIGDLVERWDKQTRQSQVRMLQESLPEDRLKEIVEERTKQLSFKSFDYLNHLSSLLPVLVEASPSLQSFVRAYKVALFQDPLPWMVTNDLGWMPCSTDDREVLSILGFKNFSEQFRKTEIKDLLPGQQRLIYAYGTGDDELMEESFNQGFNPAGIILLGPLCRQKNYEKALSVFQQLLLGGAHAIYSQFVNLCIEMLLEENLTVEMIEEICQLDYKPRDGAVSTKELGLFLRTLEDVLDNDFIAVAAKIKTICSSENWAGLLTRVDRHPSLPIMMKIQMLLVGHDELDHILKLSIWINSILWIQTVRESVDSTRLELFTVTYLLGSEKSQMDVLVHHVELSWFNQWVLTNCVAGEITEENLDRAEFFWRGMKRVLANWRAVNPMEKNKILGIRMILKHQQGLAKKQRLYQDCMNLSK
ncbi:MAG: ankyrin repeat domain-containing protein [Parachlamydiaceae bacterium]